jgi:uncharacterized protein
MMSKSTILLVFIAASSCDLSPSELTDAEKSSVVKEARLMLDNYYAEIKKGGLTAEFKYLDNSPEFFWIPPGFDEPISYDSVASILRQNAPSLKSIDNSWDTLRITPITSEVAAYTGRLRSLTIDTKGKHSEYVLIETGVLIKRKDGWKLLNGRTSMLNSVTLQKSNLGDMEQRLTIITLGVNDVKKSTEFYENNFGWKKTTASNDDISFFQLNGIQLALYKRSELAKDATISGIGTGFRGITMAHNTRSEQEVDSIITKLRAKGVKIVKEPAKVFWGGYSSYVSDLDGNLWEIAHNPFLPLDEIGNVKAQ